MPALPAFVLLAAAVPLLVPTLVDRMGPRLAPDPGRRPGLYPTAAVVGFLAVVPLAVLLLASQFRVQAESGRARLRHPRARRGRDRRPRRTPDVVSLAVRRVGDANVLRWTDSTTRARTFYRVYRSSLSRGFSDMVCEARGSRPLRPARRDARHHARPHLRRSRSACGRDLPDRRRGELARRRDPRRRLRDQPACRSAGVLGVASVAATASSASSRARSRATSCASSTLSSVSFDRTVE